MAVDLVSEGTCSRSEERNLGSQWLRESNFDGGEFSVVSSQVKITDTTPCPLFFLALHYADSRQYLTISGQAEVFNIFAGMDYQSLLVQVEHRAYLLVGAPFLDH